MKTIAIFASGRGSNALKIIEYFEGHEHVRVGLIVSNKSEAPVLTMAKQHNVPTLVLERETFYQSRNILENLTIYSIDFIVLAGFLWLIPEYLVQAYEQKIINIHPALLPKFGGKGMYGMHVHRAVREALEQESGITIHYVNTRYDEGDIIFQANCPVLPEDQPADIAHKVQRLEHLHFAKVIEELLLGTQKID